MDTTQGGSTTRTSEPTEIYGPPGAPIRVRIGNGGAGPTGVLRALAEDYITRSGQPIRIAWLQTISRLTLENLIQRVIDLSLTYDPDLELQAIKQGVARDRTRAFNDHFIIVGPAANPAQIATTDSPTTAFKRIADYAASTGRPAFLTRDDGSGTNKKELQLWRQAGVSAGDGVLVRDQEFPPDALRKAAAASLYTLTDRGTYLSTRDTLIDMRVLVQGGSDLLNPCSAMLAVTASMEAASFRVYLTSTPGQELIETFGADRFNGLALFTPAAVADFPPNQLLP